MDYASKNWVNYLFEKCKPTMGSNSYGEYTLYPDGRLHMTGWGFVTWTSGTEYKDITVTLPYEVADKDDIRAFANTSGQKESDPTSPTDVTSRGQAWCLCRALSTTQIQVTLHFSTTIAGTSRRLFSFNVWARWS